MVSRLIPPPLTPVEKAHRRSIRSFIIREGRLTPAQERAINRLFPLYGIQSLDCAGRSFDAGKTFGRGQTLVMEIGFGNGEALLEVARNNPETNFVGIEVHRPGVGRLLLEIEKRELGNIRVFCEDAVVVLDQAFPSNSFDKICLFFPDPWPKKKHNKRRILQEDFIVQIIRALKPGGIFHFASDWQAYADEALQRLSVVDDLKNLAGTNQFHPRPDDRPLTKFENRGIKRGHGVWDILMSKNS